MYGIHTVLLLFVLMAHAAVLMVAVGITLTIGRAFRAWVWRMIASPPTPPWKRYHIGLNHVRTVADTDLMKIGRLVLPNYKTAL